MARNLGFAASHAADLAQQIWHTVLEHPPRHEGALRCWLATIARNLPPMSRRAESNHRERIHRKTEPDVPEVNAAAETMILREKLRDAILLGSSQPTPVRLAHA